MNNLRRFTIRIALYIYTCLFLLSTTYAIFVLHMNFQAKLMLALFYLLLGIPLAIIEALVLTRWVSETAAGVSEVIATEDKQQRCIAADSKIPLVTDLFKRFAKFMSLINIGGFASVGLLFYLVADVYWLETIKLVAIGIAVNLIVVVGVLILLWRDVFPKLMAIVPHTTDPSSHFNVKICNRIFVLYTAISLSMTMLISVWVHGNELNHRFDSLEGRGYSFLSKSEQPNTTLTSKIPEQKLQGFEGIFTFNSRNEVVSEKGNVDLKSLISIEILEKSRKVAFGSRLMPASMMGIVYTQLEDGTTRFFVGAPYEVRKEKRFLAILIFLFFIMLGLFFGFGLYLGELTAQPVSKLSSLLLESSKSGRFNQDISILSPDDIGLVAYTVSKLYSRLDSYVGTLIETSGIVQKSLEQYKKFNFNMEKTSTDQSIALMEMAATMEEVSCASQGTSDRSEEIQQSVNQANALSNQMKSQMDQTYRNFDVLNKKIEYIDNQTVTLQTTSEAVDEIIAEISNIAKQSSLLAINASVEAAKARKHGRGFGVLAKEMKALAEQSRRSTEMARDKLKNIQRAVRETGTSVLEGRKISSHLIETATSTREVISLVNSAVDRINQDASQIVEAASQQVGTITDVTTSVDKIQMFSLRLAEGNAKLAEVFVGLDTIASQLKKMSFR